MQNFNYYTKGVWVILFDCTNKVFESRKCKPNFNNPFTTKNSSP